MAQSPEFAASKLKVGPDPSEGAPVELMCPFGETHGLPRCAQTAENGAVICLSRVSSKVAMLLGHATWSPPNDCKMIERWDG